MHEEHRQLQHSCADSVHCVSHPSGFAAGWHTIDTTWLYCVQVTIGLLRNALVGSKDKCFLVDGFPRELDQAHAFEEHIKPCK